MKAQIFLDGKVKWRKLFHRYVPNRKEGEYFYGYVHYFGKVIKLRSKDGENWLQYREGKYVDNG